MKNLLGTISILLLFITVSGQARDGSEELRKAYSSEGAVLIYLPYSPVVVKQALNAYVSNTLKKNLSDSKAFLTASNTELAKNNIDAANIIFEVGLKDYTNPNETVVYMKLNSTVDVSYPTLVAKKITFDAQQAIDFLNNFAIAIQPYATELQLGIQKKELLVAQAKCETLKKEGIKLEQEKQALANNLSQTSSRHISRRRLINQQQLDLNQAKQAIQVRELDNQKVSFASLVDSKNQ